MLHMYHIVYIMYPRLTQTRHRAFTRYCGRWGQVMGSILGVFCVCFLSLFRSSWKLLEGFLRLGTSLGRLLARFWPGARFLVICGSTAGKILPPFWAHFRTFWKLFFDRFLETLLGGILCHLWFQRHPKWEALGSRFWRHFPGPWISNFW